jgi:signal transduction histidine kinase
MPPSTPTPDRIEVRVAVRERHAMIEVRDDGCGGADPARGSGRGGLADRVSALGGTLEIKSAAGAGTTIRARLPLTPPGDASNDTGADVESSHADTESPDSADVTAVSDAAAHWA